MYRWLGQLAANHPWKICFAWLLFGVTAAFLAPSWEKNSQDDETYSDEEMYLMDYDRIQKVLDAKGSEE